MRPSDGRSSRRISRRKVDLPEPDGPTRKTNSPFSTSRVTLSSAGRLWLGYVFVTLSKWITGPITRVRQMRTLAGLGNRPAAAAWPCLAPARLAHDSLGGKLG